MGAKGGSKKASAREKRKVNARGKWWGCGPTLASGLNERAERAIGRIRQLSSIERKKRAREKIEKLGKERKREK